MSITGRYVDLDEEKKSVVVRYRGVKLAISRDRLLELLTLEEAVLSSLGDGSAREAPQVASVAAPAPDRLKADPMASIRAVAGEEQLSHATVSNRIKKIFDYAKKSRQLRPVHAGMLEELLHRFDWNLPDHPNTRLDQHLVQISSWEGVSPTLQALIRSFVAKYSEARTGGRDLAGA